MDEFIKSLNLENLPITLSQSDAHKNIYYINNSNDFSLVFNTISYDKGLTLASSYARNDQSKFRYTNGVYNVLLEANYKDDVYRLIVEEI